MARMTRMMYRKKKREQRLIGLGLLALCVLVLWISSTGTTVEDRDVGAVLLMAPMVLYMLFTKHIVIY